MYDLEQIVRGLRNPRLGISEVNKLLTRLVSGERYNTDGVDVFEEDWDNLIILDACRYDEFDRLNSLPGETQPRESRGAMSAEFVEGNFTDKCLYDTVYVASNRFYERLRDDIDAEVHDYIPVELDAPDVPSSLPETVTEAALAADEQYPNKRLMVHYMQPHQPYFGPNSDHLKNTPEIRETIRVNQMTHDEIVDAYRDNLRYVLDHVEELLDELRGKTVISADHGELLGERERPIPIKYYGHPRGVYTDELVKVPWHVYENGSRKDVVSEPPVESRREVDESVDEKLRDLGYRV